MRKLEVGPRRSFDFQLWGWFSETHVSVFWGCTPQKFNMEPEKKSLEKEIPVGNHHFSGSMLNFGGVL